MPEPFQGATLITRLAIPVKRPIGYVQLTLGGKITFADLDYSRIVERPLEDLIGRCFIDMIAGDEQDLATTRLKVLVKGRKPSQAFKNYVTPGGRSVPVLTTAWIEYDCEGSPVGIGGTDQPMTKFGLERLRASH